VIKTAIVCIALFLFCPRANAQASATILTAPFICEWANIQGGCPGMGWAAGFPTASSSVDANCGPTSVLMIASKYSGTAPSPDQISQMDAWLVSNFGASWAYSANGGKGSGTEPPELTSLAQNFFGLSNTSSFSGWTLGELKQELAQGFPVIVRVRPKMVVNYSDAHYMVLLGMDDQFVYVNDPGIRNGGQTKYKLQDFIDSWARTASWDQNNNEGVVIHPAPSSSSITVDGNPSDWAGIAPLLLDAKEGFPFPGNAGWDILSVRATNDASNVYFLFEFDSASISAQLNGGFLVYLDTDMNASTGCVLNVGDIFGAFSTIGAEGLLTFFPYNPAFPKGVLANFKNCSGSFSDFPGAVQVAAAGAFVEASVSLTALKSLTGNMNGFDIVVVSGGDATTKGRYILK
jgi:peptidase C39-like protein